MLIPLSNANMTPAERRAADRAVYRGVAEHECSRDSNEGHIGLEKQGVRRVILASIPPRKVHPFGDLDNVEGKKVPLKGKRHLWRG